MSHSNRKIHSATYVTQLGQISSSQQIIGTENTSPTPRLSPLNNGKTTNSIFTKTNKPLAPIQSQCKVSGNVGHVGENDTYKKGMTRQSVYSKVPAIIGSSQEAIRSTHNSRKDSFRNKGDVSYSGQSLPFVTRCYTRNYSYSPDGSPRSATSGFTNNRNSNWSPKGSAKKSKKRKTSKSPKRQRNVSSSVGPRKCSANHCCRECNHESLLASNSVVLQKVDLLEEKIGELHKVVSSKDFTQSTIQPNDGHQFEEPEMARKHKPRPNSDTTLLHLMRDVNHGVKTLVHRKQVKDAPYDKNCLRSAVLKECYDHLVENIEPHSLIPYLVSYEILSVDEKQVVGNENTTKRKIQRIIFYVDGYSDDGINKFILALENTHQIAVSEYLQNVNTSISDTLF